MLRNLVKFGHAVSEICVWTDRQRDRHTHTHTLVTILDTHTKGGVIMQGHMFEVT